MKQLDSLEEECVKSSNTDKKETGFSYACLPRISGVQAVPAMDDGTQVVPLSPHDPRVCNYRPQTSVLEDVEDNMVLESQGCVILLLCTVHMFTAYVCVM